MPEENEPMFARDESNPIEADAVIIDEASMIDIIIMNSLL
jgi:exodeoxyribonuclease V alpha subunit